MVFWAYKLKVVKFATGYSTSMMKANLFSPFLPTRGDDQKQFYLDTETFKLEKVSSDNETTAVEDWFKSQGHTLNEPKVGIRQRLKNAYIGK